MRVTAGVVLGALLVPGVLGAQAVRGSRVGAPVATPPQVSGAVGTAEAGLSLLVPGLGQHRLGNSRRALAFAVVEVVSWTVFLERRSAGSSARDAYRDYAWQHGRIQGASRVDGDFDYYETLTKWSRSGAFDIDTDTPGVQPEADASTFNGAIWSRARGLFMGSGAGLPGDPGYEQAVSYYVEHAYGTELLWDWSSTVGGQGELAERIEEGDELFRQATTALGVVIANHVLSSIEAFVSGRSKAGAARVRLTPGPTGSGWSVHARIGVGR